MPEEPVSRRLMQQDIKGSTGWINAERFTIDANPDTPTTREMMLGPHAYALLPGKNAAALATYAAKPGFLITENSGEAHSVSKPGRGSARRELLDRYSENSGRHYVRPDCFGAGHGGSRPGSYCGGGPHAGR